FVVSPGDRLLDEGESRFFGKICVAVVGVDDSDTLPVAIEVPENERQSPAADRAEADHHDGAIPGGIDRPIGHGRTLLPKKNRRRIGSLAELVLAQHKKLGCLPAPGLHLPVTGYHVRWSASANCGLAQSDRLLPHTAQPGSTAR